MLWSRLKSSLLELADRFTSTVSRRVSFVYHHPYLLKNPLFLGPRAAVLLAFASLLFFVSSTFRPEFYDASADEVDYNLPSLSIKIDSSSWGSTGQLVLDTSALETPISGTITTAVTSSYVGYKLFIHFNSTDFVSEDTLSTIPAITTPASTLAEGHWAYRIGDTGNYLVPMATEATKSLIASDTTPHPTPVEHTVGIYVDTTGVPAKTYENIAHFTVEPYSTQYSVHYYENKPTGVTDSVSGMPTAFTGDIATLGSPYTYTLSTSTPTLTGYTFCGWGKRSTSTCGSADIITSLSLSSSYPSANVYAIWQEKSEEPTPTISSIDFMDEMTPEICLQLKSSPLTRKYLVDRRDGKEYVIFRVEYNDESVEGGKSSFCWMSQNLDVSTSSILAFYNANKDSDTVTIHSGSRAKQVPFEDIYYRYMENGSLTSAFTDFRNDIDDYEDDYFLTTDTTDLTKLTKVPKSDTSDTTPYTSHSATTNYGSYYNYASAFANPINNDTDPFTGTATAGNRVSSICPSGWRLPTDAEWTHIMTRNSTYDTLQNNPISLVPSGTGDPYNTNTSWPEAKPGTGIRYFSSNFSKTSNSVEFVKAHLFTSINPLYEEDVNSSYGTAAPSIIEYFDYDAEGNYRDWPLVNIRCIFEGSFGILYDANAPEGFRDEDVWNMPYGTTITDSGTTMTLDIDHLGPVVSDDYTFCGWSLNPSDTCRDGLYHYSNAETSTITLGGDSGLPRRVKLYAIWDRVDTEERRLNITFQDFTQEDCDSLLANTVYSGVIDARDMQEYYITRIDDKSGNSFCIMTRKNLDVSSQSIKGAYSAGDVSFQYAKDGLFTSYYTNFVNDWNDDYDDYFTTTIPSTLLDMTKNNGRATPYASHSTTTNYGSYYNYASAFANPINNDTDPFTGTATAGNRVSSICPSGWRLPTDAEWSTIIADGVTYTNFRGTPYEFLPSGTGDPYNTNTSWPEAKPGTGIRYFSSNFSKTSNSVEFVKAHLFTSINPLYEEDVNSSYGTAAPSIIEYFDYDAEGNYRDWPLVNIRCIFEGSFGILYDANVTGDERLPGFTNESVVRMPYGNSVTTTASTATFTVDHLPDDLTHNTGDNSYPYAWSLRDDVKCVGDEIVEGEDAVLYNEGDTITLGGEGGFPRRITLHAVWCTP